MAQEIYIIDNGLELKKTISDLFKKEKEIKLKKVSSEKIDDMLKNIPSLIIINEDQIDENIIEVCKRIRLNEDNKFNVNYSYLISEYRSHLDSLKPKFKINEFE